MTVYRTGLVAALLCLSFAACVPAAPPVQPLPDDGLADDGLADACGATGLQGLVGQPEGVLETMRFSQTLRVIRPGIAVTMDYSPFRLNILTDAAGRIERIFCG